MVQCLLFVSRSRRQWRAGPLLNGIGFFLCFPEFLRGQGSIPRDQVALNVSWRECPHRPSCWINPQQPNRSAGNDVTKIPCVQHRFYMSFGWVVTWGLENQLVILSAKISVVAAEDHDRWGLLDRNQSVILIANCDRCARRIRMDSHGFVAPIHDRSATVPKCQRS